MNLIEHFREAVRERAAGKTCPHPHGDGTWTEMDTIAVRYFIPEDLRKVYWATRQQKWLEAYQTTSGLLERLHHLPYLWRLPETLRVNKYESIPMEEAIQTALNARGNYMQHTQRKQA